MCSALSENILEHLSGGGRNSPPSSPGGSPLRPMADLDGSRHPHPHPHTASASASASHSSSPWRLPSSPRAGALGGRSGGMRDSISGMAEMGSRVGNTPLFVCTLELHPPQENCEAAISLSLDEMEVVISPAAQWINSLGTFVTWPKDLGFWADMEGAAKTSISALVLALTHPHSVTPPNPQPDHNKTHSSITGPVRYRCIFDIFAILDIFDIYQWLR